MLFAITTILLAATGDDAVRAGVCLAAVVRYACKVEGDCSVCTRSLTFDLQPLEPLAQERLVLDEIGPPQKGELANYSDRARVPSKDQWVLALDDPGRALSHFGQKGLGR